MEQSASAPALGGTHEVDYQVPKYNGVSGPRERVTQGPFSKDTGKNSSRINVIIKQAEKNPGPGKYLAHVDYGEEKNRSCVVNAFAKGSRHYKPMNKVPSPDHYEGKDVTTSRSLAARENLSHVPRILHGKMPTGKRRSFLDGAERHGASTPAPGFYEVTNKSHTLNKLDTKVLNVPTLANLAKSKSLAAPPKEIGPDQYNPNFNQTEHQDPNFSVPKQQAANFIDKAVRERMLDPRNKIPEPGPGHHDFPSMPLSKVSRGCKYTQLRGMGRSPASGYF